jgi:hypothetical protein
VENVLRGSGDIGAILVTCGGLSQIDAASNRNFAQNVKARDFFPCEPFIIHLRVLNTGHRRSPNDTVPCDAWDFRAVNVPVN